jgi:hypothetical protein
MEAATGAGAAGVRAGVRRTINDMEVDMSDNHCNHGLDDRCRDADGEIRRKRSDTLVGTLRREYGDGFAESFRSDAKLGTVLKETSSSSLSDYLKHRR